VNQSQHEYQISETTPQTTTTTTMQSIDQTPNQPSNWFSLSLPGSPLFSFLPTSLLSAPPPPQEIPNSPLETATQWLYSSYSSLSSNLFNYSSSQTTPHSSVSSTSSIFQWSYDFLTKPFR
jgi:hypothetical protein